MHAPQAHEIRQQVDKILASPKFKEPTRSRRFLEFIVQEALAGNSADLKENIVGINVFDRAIDYDPRLDSIVRVEAGRLRNKLNDYYEQEGRNDSLIAVLPKGSYAPEFIWRAREEIDASSGIESTAQPTAAQTSSRKAWLIAFSALLAIGIGTTATFYSQPKKSPPRIAVLPFTPYSSDEHDRIIADQLTQKVTAEFVRLDTFNIVPSTSARRYEDRRPGVQEIATALNADILLEGRTMSEGSIVKVELRLSDGVLDRKFWVSDSLSGDSVEQLAKQIALAANAAAIKKKPAQ